MMKNRLKSILLLASSLFLGLAASVPFSSMEKVEAASNDLWVANNGEYTITQANSHYQCSGWDGSVYHDPFYLINNPNASNSNGYDVAATFYNTASTPMETLQYGTVKFGFLPYYLNQNNFVCIYCFWENSTSTTKMRSINATICSNGNFYEYDLSWVHDNNTYSALQRNSNYSSGYRFNVRVTSSNITFSINNVTINLLNALNTSNCHMSTFINSNAKIGLWSWWSDTKVNNVSSAAISSSTISDANWKNIGSNESVWTIPSGAATFRSTNTSWMDNFAVTTGANYQCSFKMDATFTGTRTSAASGNNVIMGFVPFYIDAQNYIMIYGQWISSNTTGINEVVVTGKIRNENIKASCQSFNDMAGKNEFHDIWLNNNNSVKNIKPNSGFRFVIDRTYDANKNHYIFKLYCGPSLTHIADIFVNNFSNVDASKQCYAGFLTQNDTVTITNYSVTNYGNNGNVGVGKSGNGGFSVNNSSLWSFNPNSGTLLASQYASTSTLNTYLNNYALKKNNNKNYTVGARIKGLPSDNEYCDAKSAARRRIGLYAYRSSDGNSRVLVDLWHWSDAPNYTTVEISVILNGSAPSDGEWLTLQINHRFKYITEFHSLEVKITGDTIDVYLDNINSYSVVGKSGSVALSRTVPGLANVINADTGYYGAHVQNIGGEFVNLTTSTGRVYSSLINYKPVISYAGSPTTGKVNNIIFIYAKANTLKYINENITPVVTVKNSNNVTQTVHHVALSSATKDTPYYFVPTVAGTYTVTINATDRFGTAAKAVSYTVTIT